MTTPFFQKVQKLMRTNNIVDKMFQEGGIARDPEVWGDIKFKVIRSYNSRDSIVYQFSDKYDSCYVVFQGMTKLNGEHHVVAYFEAEPVMRPEFVGIGYYPTC